MIDKGLISVIVAIFNVESFIDKCVFSIVNQTYQNLEIILVNDGSTDNSLQKCLQWKKQDRRIIVVDKENGGVSSARNEGILRSTGKWISFVDGDDYLEENAIEKMVSFIDDSDILIANYYVDSSKGSRKEFFFNSGDTIFSSKEERIEVIKNCFVRSKIASGNSITLVGVPWAKLYSSELIKKRKIIFDERLKKMQDAIFNLEAIYYSEKIIYMQNMNIYHYFQNDLSVTHRCNSDYQYIADIFLTAFQEAIHKYELYELDGVLCAKRFMLVLECIKFIYLLDGKKKLPDKISGSCQLLRKLSFSAEDKRKMISYLSGPHRIAFSLYKLGMYRTIFMMSYVYLFYKKVI